MVESVIAGDSAEWMLRTADRFGCAPEEATAKAFLRLNGSLKELATERKDGLILIRLTPAVSGTLQPGEAVLIVRLETADGEFRRSEVIGKMLVKPGIENGDFEHRSEAQICLDQAKRALADYTSGRSRVRSYTIGTRSLTFNSAQELMDLVKYWQTQVYLEECARADVDPRRMLAEFVP